MVAQRTPRYITPQEYLEREFESDTKNEYVNGVIVAMAGATPLDIRLTRNITVELEPYIRRARYESYPTEMRVRISTSNRYYYSDYVVVCGKPEFEKYKGLDLLNPTLIIEVLSDSTEKRDRGEKLFAYKNMETLRDYLLVHQDRPLIEIYSRRSAEHAWEFDTVEGLGSVLPLAVLNCDVPLSALYYDVEFEEDRYASWQLPAED